MTPDAGGANDASHVEARLREKLDALNEAAAALEDALADADPVDKPAIQWVLDAVNAEIALVKARIDTLVAGTPLARPGPEQDAALMSAIAAVGAAVAAGDVANGLLAAATDLVNAYKV